MQSIIKLSSVKILAIVIAAFCLLFSVTKAFAQGMTADDCLERVKGSVILKIGSPVAFNGNRIITVDSNNHGILPFIYNDNTYVPLSFVVESFGAVLECDEFTDLVIIDGKPLKSILSIDTPKMTVADEDKTADAAVLRYNEWLFVSIKGLSKDIGYNVFYDDDSGLIAISKYDVAQMLTIDEDLMDGLISAVTAIPMVGTKENLKRLISYSAGAIEYTGQDGPSGAQGPAGPQATGVDSSGTIGGSTDFSKTNVQVEGVDEADIVKTDGKYIYTVSNRRVAIARAYPVSDMKVEKILTFATSFAPQELYVNGDKLVIIGTESKGVNLPEYTDQDNKNTVTERVTFSLAYVYDISDKANPKQLKEISIEGRNITSRMIGNKVYIVAERRLNDYSYNYCRINDEWRPMYFDSAVSKDALFVDYDKIGYLPDVVASSYIITAGLDLDNPSEEISLTTILGSDSIVYASADNMYIIPHSSYFVIPAMARDTIAEKWGKVVVYKFSLENLSAKLVATSVIYGTVLNQFSMDEYDGNFRIATTSNSGFRTNNIFVFDENMRQVGEITDIARNERIYSVRFMGKKAYMVTYKQVDPLFVINMADPKNPFIEGELKIPGYSNYLHPYDDEHLIGFGRQTDGVKGIKISMFDVSDVNNPKELFNTVIPNTDSDLNLTHKSLLFSKEKDIFAFPVYSYSRFNDFTGLYAYGIDFKKGFTLRGEVTHNYDTTADYSKRIQRSLYIDDVLYTISMVAIKANNLEDFKEIKFLTLN